MTRDKQVSAVPVSPDIGAGNFRVCDDIDIRQLSQVIDRYFGIPGMGRIENVVETPDNRSQRIHETMQVDTANLFRQHSLFDAIEMVHGSLYSPAQK